MKRTGNIFNDYKKSVDILNLEMKVFISLFNIFRKVNYKLINTMYNDGIIIFVYEAIYNKTEKIMIKQIFPSAEFYIVDDKQYLIIKF